MGKRKGRFLFAIVTEKNKNKTEMKNKMMGMKKKRKEKREAVQGSKAIFFFILPRRLWFLWPQILSVDLFLSQLFRTSPIAAD